MNTIPQFPAFAPVSASMYKQLYPFLNNLPDGISEFTFLNLYLYRSKYDYRISRLAPSSALSEVGASDLKGVLDVFVVNGYDKKGSFFFIMGGMPEKEQVCDLLKTYRRWKNIGQTHYQAYLNYMSEKGYAVYEDRDNEDYLYTRESLATLAGKALHKKRNLANGFENAYKWTVNPLTEKNAADAGVVLDSWAASRIEDGIADYEQCANALEVLAITNFTGWIVYVEDKPVAWALGEYIASGKMFLVHFEKAVDSYRGVYQFVNRATARALPEAVEFINREQDLGDEGLRQAKMTYRPSSFVKKYYILDTEEPV